MTTIARAAADEASDAKAVTPVGLGVVKGLFGRLENEKIRYCHWKSNEHITAAVLGQTDLDVLVEQGRTDDLHRCLAECGFRRFQATAMTAYPAVEDYIAVDSETATLVHLHLHYRFTLGEKHLKGYRLPWEEGALSDSRPDEEHGIQVISPEMELLLLLVRDALKRRFRSRVSALVRREKRTGDFYREYTWLVARSEQDKLEALAEKLIAPESVEPLRQLLQSDADPSERAAFSKVVRPSLAIHRSYSRLSSAILTKVREFVWILGGLSKRKFHWAVPLRRVSPRGGIVVTFLGSDGAGKSTLTADTIAWLGQKLDVVPVYFGSGDGSASLLRLPLKFARRLVDRRVKSTTPTERRSGARGRLRKIALFPWALSLSAEKRSKLRRMNRARNRGMIVICDRFPQNQFLGFNDGPLLSEFVSSERWLPRTLAQWEAKPYAEASRVAPDIVIKLIASPEVALLRRPEMSEDEILERIDSIRSLEFPKTTRVRLVNADEPLDDVIRTVRKLIWECL